MIIYPRWIALGCVAFALAMLYTMGATLKRPSASLFIKIFTLLGCGAAVAAGFVFAYHIALGQPIRKVTPAQPADAQQTP